MTLNDICEIKTDFIGADDWLKTKTVDGKGKPIKTYNKEYIGIKVIRRDLLVPDYLFYMLTYYYTMGVFKNFNLTTINDMQLNFTN